jgi:hypothetical protein
VRGGLGWAAHSEQEVAEVEEGAAVAFGARGTHGKGKGEE